jgi:hypothetical protein
MQLFSSSPAAAPHDVIHLLRGRQQTVLDAWLDGRASDAPAAARHVTLSAAALRGATSSRRCMRSPRQTRSAVARTFKADLDFTHMLPVDPQRLRVWTIVATEDGKYRLPTVKMISSTRCRRARRSKQERSAGSNVTVAIETIRCDGTPCIPRYNLSLACWPSAGGVKRVWCCPPAPTTKNTCEV